MHLTGNATSPRKNKFDAIKFEKQRLCITFRWEERKCKDLVKCVLFAVQTNANYYMQTLDLKTVTDKMTTIRGIQSRSSLIQSSVSATFETNHSYALIVSMRKTVFMLLQVREVSFLNYHLLLVGNKETSELSKEEKMANCFVLCALFLAVAVLVCSAQEDQDISVR